MTMAGRDAPALGMLFSKAEMARLDGRAVAVVNAQAAITNPCIVALCVLVLVVVWKGLVNGKRWAFWAIALVLLPLQIFGFVSDAFLGHRNLVANVASSVILVSGVTLAGFGLRRHVNPGD